MVFTFFCIQAPVSQQDFQQQCCQPVLFQGTVIGHHGRSIAVCAYVRELPWTVVDYRVRSAVAIAQDQLHIEDRQYLEQAAHAYVFRISF